jgi:hypothetical protein
MGKNLYLDGNTVPLWTGKHKDQLRKQERRTLESPNLGFERPARIGDFRVPGTARRRKKNSSNRRTSNLPAQAGIE